MGIENFLKWIEAITVALPLIEKIVTMIEGLFAKLGAGQGEEKKESALELSKSALASAGLELPDEALGGMIDAVVKVKNATGEFTHGLSQAPPC